MKVYLKRADDAFHLEARNEDGRTVHIDAAEKVGGKNLGVRPMQMLLMALAACSGIDIVSILLKQRQSISDFQIEVEGERENIKDGAAVFEKVNVQFKLKGRIDKQKAQRATELSIGKYCSVAKTLRAAGAEIKHEVFVNEKKI